MSINSTIIYDGDFSQPVEIEGSPLIGTDPVTRSKIILRNYVVWKTSYNPLIIGNFIAIPDRQFPTAILIEEVPQQCVGPFFYFQRVYCEVPNTRVEPLAYAWTVPGKASPTFSRLTGKAVNWRQYGNGAPYTRVVNAAVTYTYAAGDPASDGSGIFTVPTLSRITYNSVSGPISVDYVGDVYEFQGTRAITNVQGGITVLTGAEPDFILVGSTNPRVLPTTWVAEANIRRWRGAIWEMQVIRLTTTGL